jgi:hypothetical protein
MNKIALSLILASLVGAAYALSPDRIVEVTAQAGVSASNNYFPLSDVFQNPLVIDLDAMAASLPSEGWTLALGGAGEVGINLRPSPYFRLGFFAGAEVTGFANLPQSLFALVSQGNALDQSYTGSLGLRGDVFAETGMWFGTRILGLDVTLRPAYYVPLLHVGNSTAAYTLESGSDGSTNATARASVPVYSAVPLNSTTGISPDLDRLLHSGGVDLGLEAEYPVFKWLTLGIDFVHIPILLARMDQETLFQYDYDFSMSNVLANYSSSSLYQTSQTSSAASSTTPITVARPLDLDFHATIFPFSNPVLSLTPSIGLGVYDGTYINEGLKAELNLGDWFILSLSSQLEDRLWNQELGVDLNLRLFEVDLLVGGQSSDFQASFNSGISASIGIKVGL